MRFASHGPRYARLSREGLEQIEHKLAADMMKLDQALREGPQSGLWEPRPGAQCLHCEVASSCPVPSRQRGEGAIESQVDADIEARRWARGKAMYTQAAERLKARSDAGLPPGQVTGGKELRWGPEPDAWRQKGGGRKFDLFPAVETTTEDAAA
jgi:hypothetical protein